MSVVHVGSACNTCTGFNRQSRHRFRASTFRPVQAFWPFNQTKSSTSAASVKQAKSKLAQLAGKKYGHDLNESQKQDVKDVLRELEALDRGRTGSKDLTGTNWKLLYTESTGSSGGKVGLLVGQVDQAIASSICTATEH